MKARAAVVFGMLLAAGAVGAPIDKAATVRLSAFRYLAQSGAPPAGWTDPGFDDKSWAGPAAGPFAPRPPFSLMGAPSGATLYDYVPNPTLYLRARFDVQDVARVRVLELRVGYGDGFIAYVNGREVARRGIAPGTPAGAPAVPHGPEVERVFVAVPSPGVQRLAAVGNVLAVEVRPFPGRSALAPSAPTAAVDLAAATGVRVVRGPYLIAPSEGRHGAGLSVAWETDLPAGGTVTLTYPPSEGATVEITRRFDAQAPALRQVIALKDLPQARRLRYRVDVAGPGGDAVSSGPHAFETLPPAARPLRFAVYGDMRYPGHDAHRTVIDALVREAPALVFNTGDLTDMGSEESNWQRYFEITAPLGAIAPVVPALGNHDAARAGQGAQLTWSLFGLPSAAPPGTAPGWTSLDLGGVHFIVLDTNAMANPAQKAWLADDLGRARRHHARAIFAFCHEGPWSHGLHGNSAMMIRDYAPLLAGGALDVLFSGHDHIYERGTGSTPAGKVTYVVTGGGGAPLYNPTCRAASGPPPGDVPGPLPACPSSVAVLTKAYHYIIVEVGPDAISVCPRRPDGSPLEPCVKLPLRRR